MRILFLLLISVGCLKAQDDVTVVLEKISSSDVIFETKEARISFSKKDILDDFKIFKTEYSFQDKEEEKKYDNAIAYLKKNKRTIKLVEGEAYDQPGLSSLAELIKVRSGASLINKKQAQIVRKSDQQIQESILVRSLIGSPNGSVYSFMFNDSSKFFYGELYGEMIFIMETK
ncbi:MAG TPA: hypothetical protein VIT44_13630 [Cyclobacteriaceae bacterium]